jgi:integrase
MALPPSRCATFHICLHKALEDATRKSKRLVARNPADDADPPKQASPGSKEKATWTRSHLNAFLDHVRGDRFYAAYLLAARTGMRRGEILGLRLQDFDPEHGRIQVRQTLVSTDYKLAFSEPKTERGKRSLKLDAETVAALQAHIERQADEAKADYYSDHRLVFANPDGTPKASGAAVPGVRAPHPGRGPPGDPVPRPAPHLRDTRSPGGHQREDRVIEARARQRRLHAQRL